MRSLTVPVLGCTLVLLLSACGNAPTVTPPATEEVSSSSVAPAETTYVGLLGSSVIGIYMEGTHRLQTAAGVDILLRSDTVDLDAYLGRTVAVTGVAGPTVEEGGTIVDVRSVEALDSEPVASSSVAASSVASSVTASAVASVSTASSVAAVASSAAVSSKVPVASSSVSSVVQSSSVATAASSSVAAPDGETQNQQRAAVMAKAKVDATTFTQIFCSSHVGFCAPLHKSWYYNSFGATSTTLWHVEVSSEAVEELGDGPLVVNLVSGALPAGVADESVVEQGEFVVAYRAWTNNRHFEISAPKALRDAVTYMIKALSVYQVDASSSSRSSTSAASSV